MVNCRRRVVLIYYRGASGTRNGCNLCRFLTEFLQRSLELLAPPLFSKIDKDTGHLQKRRFGSWMFKAFKILSNFKFLRGTKFDLFGYTAERNSERVLAQKIMNTIIACIRLVNLCIILIKELILMRTYP